MKRFLYLVCSLSVCSILFTNEAVSQTITENDTKPAEQKSVAPTEKALNRIYFYRNRQTGLGVQPSISLNGQAIGVSPVGGGYFYVEKPPGDYEIVTKNYFDTRTARLTLENARTAYVRISFGFMPFLGSYLYPEVVDSLVGEKEIQGLSPSGGPEK